MRVAISQPTYLPWIGYLDLIDSVDVFVFLNEVQFEKRSWQQRNRIKTPEGLRWLTVPVLVGGRYEQLIREVEISEAEFCRPHCKAIELNYRRAPFFELYYQALTSQLAVEGPLLADLNVRLVKWFMSVMGITTPTILASETQSRGTRKELLASICKELGATEYLSPLGSAVYLLEEKNIFAARGIDVVFQHYEHPEYRQLFPPFLPYASALDLIFNEGDGAYEIMRKGRRSPFAPEEVANTFSQAQAG